MVEECSYNKLSMNFFGGKEVEDNRRQENGQTIFCFIFLKFPFLGTFKKK